MEQNSSGASLMEQNSSGALASSKASLSKRKYFTELTSEFWCRDSFDVVAKLWVWTCKLPKTRRETSHMATAPPKLGSKNRGMTLVLGRRAIMERVGRGP